MIPLDLGYTYYGHEDMYPRYDNYDAINVDKVSQIPYDYEPCWFKCPHAISCHYAQTEGKEDVALCEQTCNGEMGVPISYLDKHCPEQMKILANGGSYVGAGSIAEALYVSSNACSQIVQVERERERDERCSNELLFAGCSKCNGIIGVPISFLDKFCPAQFRLLEMCASHGVKPRGIDNESGCINGKWCYARVLIQKV